MKRIERHPSPPSRTPRPWESEDVKNRRFVDQYLIDLDAAKAAVRAGLPETAGHRLLAKTSVQVLIAKEREARQSRTSIFADEVLRRWWQVACADPRELVEIRRGCCRYCYGIDHRYQFTQEELRRAVADHVRDQRRKGIPQEQWVEFDDQGGDGYVGTRDPNPNCPECWGEGIMHVYLRDSRYYGRAAAALFDGVKVGKDGSVEIKFRDRDHAMDRVAQHLGMLVTRQAVMTIDPSKMTDDQLEGVIKHFEARLGGSRPDDEFGGTVTDRATIDEGEYVEIVPSEKENEDC